MLSLECLLVAGPTPLFAADEKLPEDRDYTQGVRPLLQKFCFQCHGEKTAKGGLRLDTLSKDFRTARAAAGWKDVLERVVDETETQMPPQGKPRPSADEIKALRGWIETRRKSAALADAAEQRTESRAQLRRLNRVEYTWARPSEE